MGGPWDGGRPGYLLISSHIRYTTTTKRGFFYLGSLVFFLAGGYFFFLSYACQRPFLTLSLAMSGDFFYVLCLRCCFYYVLWEAQAIGDETLVLFLFEREAWR